jgi:NADH dehydrogenase FAD-containing subunit
MGHLVLAGGGHAHMTVMQRLAEFQQRGHKVTLVSPDRYHYYSGMGPGLLAGFYLPQEIRFDVCKMVTSRGARFICDAVNLVRPESRRLELASGRSLPYDVVSFNVGSEVYAGPHFEPDERLIAVKPIANLEHARKSLLGEPAGRLLRLIVAGGGPAGTEIAGNLRRLLDSTNRQGEVLLIAGSRLLGDFPPRMRQCVLDEFDERNIDVREGLHLTAYSHGRATLDDGSTINADYLFLAMGVRPPELFRRSGLEVGADGGLLVNRFLQAQDHPGLFGGGDCICFGDHPLAKVGVYAVRQNPVLLENLLSALDGKPLYPFVPQKNFLLILNTGAGRGVLHWRGLVASGRWVFRLKDRIDRRFMRKYQ